MANQVLAGILAVTGTLTAKFGGTAALGTFKLGTYGSEATLPEVSEYHVDPVVVGGFHVLLNGKAIADEMGRRYHFYLAWKGLTEVQAYAIDSAFFAAAPLSFMDKNGTYRVVRGNHSPWEYDTVGYVSFNIELEEA